MTKANHYKWLIVVEGPTDELTYKILLGKFGASNYYIVRGGGTRVCNMAQWDQVSCGKDECGKDVNLLDILRNDLGRAGFKGVILLIDSDTNDKLFTGVYTRTSDPKFVYEQPQPTGTSKGNYWHLDTLCGKDMIPILGIAVPAGRAGCLETAMLAAYGFPIESQPEYDCLTKIIIKASTAWKIPKKGDGKEWWEENTKAKIDKFIYQSFLHGFEVAANVKTSHLCPNEPEAIKHIKEAMNFSFGSSTNYSASPTP